MLNFSTTINEIKWFWNLNVKAGRNGNFTVVGIPNVAIFNDEARKRCNYVFDSLLDLLNYLKKK